MMNDRKKSSRILSPVVEQNEERVLMTAKVFDTEPNDTIAQIVPLVQREVDVKGRINTGTDVDLYTATIPVNGTTLLKFKAEGRLPATVTVTNSTGTVIGTLGTGTGVRQIAVPAGEVLNFSVTGSNRARYEMEFKLARNFNPSPVNPPPVTPPPVTPTPVTPPVPGTNVVSEVEFNDNRFAANAVAFDTAAMPTISGSVTRRTDKYDWFSMTPPESGTLTLTVRNPNGGRMVGLEVIDAATGRKMAETKPEYGRNTIAFNVMAGRGFYLKVESEGYSTQNYLIDSGFNAGTVIGSTNSLSAYGSSGLNVNDHSSESYVGLYDDIDGDQDGDNHDNDNDYHVMRSFRRWRR